MTFPEQIAGVPISWIQQGWRLQPSNEFDSGWRRQSTLNRWDYEAIEVDGAYLDIARPVIERPNGPRVYAHEGWGEGLDPTVEMVKIWTWWWLKTVNGLEPVKPTIIKNWDGDTSGGFRNIDQFKFAGPVLPPMEAT